MANVTKEAINLREELSRITDKPPQPPWQTFEFAGDGSETDYVMAKGWKPLAVYDAGSRQTEGSGDDYTVTFDGYLYSVIFDTAPTNLNVILVDAWRTS